MYNWKLTDLLVVVVVVVAVVVVLGVALEVVALHPAPNRPHLLRNNSIYFNLLKFTYKILKKHNLIKNYKSLI